MKPQTLQEVVRQSIMLGPINQVEERSYLMLREFIVAKFEFAIDKFQDKKGGAISYKEKLIRDECEREMRALLDELIQRDPTPTGGQR